ncbi:hypothetical protein QCA50_003139 [Cerrena zonata]|uniref:Ribosomal protein S21 n=1 Tax=Cerrena zonata TaxID=2478898 RepID=A0AAW0GJT7_9APHY
MSMLSSLVHSIGSTLGTTAKRTLGSPTTRGALQIRKNSNRSNYWGSDTWKFIKSSSELANSPEKTHMKKAASDAPFRRPPGPYAGRSVPVNNEKSFTGAYMELQQILRRNLVSYELRLAERHEKKGYKRRRLASDRHRRRFAHEVRKKVQLVNEIRARGA